MSYKYKGFIPQNVAPKGAEKIGVYDAGGSCICEIPLGGLTPDTEDKLYSFGLLSDLHCAGNNSTAGKRLDKALDYFEEQGCLFCCHSGDMTNVGLWYPPQDAEGTSIDPTVIYLNQMAEYKSVRETHPNFPVYGICGNHESYTREIPENKAELKEYTGLDSFYYTVSHDNDVFVFVGQEKANKPMSDEALQWLYETLETNRNKRCFVFIHPYVSNDDSGNPYGIYGNNLFAGWGTKATEFINLMNHYKNTILFHGHSHMVFEMQEEVSNSNYSEVLGFRSVHVPSISGNRKIVDGAIVKTDDCYGYLVDVYENHIILNGLDLRNNSIVPIGTFKIDTTLHTIEAKTVTDPAADPDGVVGMYDLVGGTFYTNAGTGTLTAGAAV